MSSVSNLRLLCDQLHVHLSKITIPVHSLGLDHVKSLLNIEACELVLSVAKVKSFLNWYSLFLLF